MMKFPRLLFFFVCSNLFSQTYVGSQERFPRFEECETVLFEEEENCFNQTLKSHIKEGFEMPQVVLDAEYKGEVVVLFEVTSEGVFETLYVDAVYKELEEEVERIFDSLPKVKPATYDNRPINIQFRMPIRIPLEDTEADTTAGEPGDAEQVQLKEQEEKRIAPEDEYDAIVSEEFQNPKVSSRINIPFSHELYSRFDDELNAVGTNFHSASKPYLYHEIQPYYDLAEETQRLKKDVSSWWGRKLWNEHLFRFQGEDYWFTADVALDLQLGKDFGSEFDVTYNNTRAAILQGGLGKNFSFYTVLYESQGRFSDYYNHYAESLKPDGGDPAIIPGRGIAKPFMGQGYDYPAAEGYLSYSPSKFFNLQFGHGKQFIGDGYRSLFMSDNATPYPYFKLTTSFWKIKYTNTWMSLRDVRPAVTGDGSFRTKYMANHYLSYNVTKRLNFGFFESVMWENDNNRGFDLNYLNPVIFYRAIEFSTGARAGNAILGLSAKYKFSDSFNMYGQWLIDEFSSGDIFGGEGSWKNKLGFQVGAKYYNAFGVDDLLLQMEYNQVRPYAYSHNTITLNYGHNNQSMAHQWGANFREVVGIARYKKDRYYGHLKMVYGYRGFDYNAFGDDFAYGGDIYTSEEDRPYETGVEIGQGNTSDSFFGEIRAGYIVNPSTNLKFFGSFIFRSFDVLRDTPSHFDSNTSWVNIGLRTDVFNWYYDY